MLGRRCVPHATLLYRDGADRAQVRVPLSGSTVDCCRFLVPRNESSAGLLLLTESTVGLTTLSHAFLQRLASATVMFSSCRILGALQVTRGVCITYCGVICARGLLLL